MRNEIEENYSLIKNFLLKECVTIFGVADITNLNFTIPELKKFQFGISIGWRLSKSVLSTLVDGPNQIYYFHYQRVNILLDTIGLKLVDLIQQKGYNAFPVPASQIIDWTKPGGEGIVSHKDVAYLSGLGWLGKNNLLVHPEYGSQVRYTTVLTDMPIKINKKFLNEQCYECKKCADICPAGAISTSCKEFKLDLCINKLIEFKKQRNLPQLICGLCVKVCEGVK